MLQLIQPRHSYAPPSHEERLGHIYFPTGLYTAAARLRAAQMDVEVVDENIAPIENSPPLVGLAVIGPPYIHAAHALSHPMRRAATDSRVIVGGQGVRAFRPDQFRSLFGDRAINGSDDRAVLDALGCPDATLPPQEIISLVDELARLSDETFKLYFSREFSLYLSQGCRYSCTFCSAVRTHRDALSGAMVRVQEQYRQPAIVAQELSYILSRSHLCGILDIHIYLSNLDLFQTPVDLERFLDAISPILSASSVRVTFRGLATTQSFLALHRSQPYLIERFADLGLRRVGFGIDGATPAVWKGIRKPQTSDSCLTAIQIAAEIYGLIPEALMVFGHEGHDDAASLAMAVDTTKRLVAEFGAIPRPHVAKGVIPGNDGWADPVNHEKVNYLLANPAAFQMLDYTCLPSWLTHEDERFRADVTDAFLEICQMPGTLTQYVKPEDPESSPAELAEAKAFNQGKYDI